MNRRIATIVAGLVAIGGSGFTVGQLNSADATPGSTDHVLAISVDGLNPTALTQLGRSQLPNFWRLLDEGKSTLNARTSLEKTNTLPNHVGMVTGERVRADLGGHGVTINDDTTRTVHSFAGQYIYSMFEVAGNSNMDSAVYTGKSKFSIMPNSWADLDTYLLEPDLTDLTSAVIDDMLTDQTELIFFHIRNMDEAGHRYGWMSNQYLEAARTVDGQLGRILETIDANPGMKDSLSIILTADHGGTPGTKGHSGVRNPSNYTIPFLAWGVGVTSGDIYQANPDFLNPGTTRPNYRPVRQPVRNINLANLSLDLLGLGSVPNSGIDPNQTLDVN